MYQIKVNNVQKKLNHNVDTKRVNHNEWQLI